MKKSLTTLSILLSGALLAGGVMAQQPTTPTTIEGVPTKPAPVRRATTEDARERVRDDAKAANRAGEALPGGPVNADAGEPSDSIATSASPMQSRSQVRHEARRQHDPVGGEGDDLGRKPAM